MVRLVVFTLILILGFQAKAQSYFGNAPENLGSDRCQSISRSPATIVPQEDNGSCCPGFTPYQNQCYRDGSFPNLAKCRSKNLYFDAVTKDCPEANTQSAAAAVQTDWGKQCREQMQKAEGTCDMSQDKGIQGALGMANQIKDQMDNTALSNLQMACSGMGKLSQMMNAGLAGYKTYCSTDFASCSDVCETDYKAVNDAYTAGQAVMNGTTVGLNNPAYPTREQVSEVSGYRKRCNALAQNVQGAQEGIMKYMAVDQAMQNCSLLTGNTLAEQCKKDPASSPLCSLAGNTDCSIPAVAASNLVCKCRANPGLAECGGGFGNNGGGIRNDSSSTDAGADGSGNLGNFGGSGGSGAGTMGDLASGEANKNPDGSLNRGGTGKSSIGESGGTGSNRNGGGGGGGGSGINAKIIGGYGFGGGAGGYAGSGGAGSQGGYAQNRNGNAGPNGQRVDLRQFLPGGQRDPSRGLAGISGPDGITGPNSDIWKKINTRYTAVTSTLLP